MSLHDRSSVDDLISVIDLDLDEEDDLDFDPSPYALDFSHADSPISSSDAHSDITAALDTEDEEEEGARFLEALLGEGPGRNMAELAAELNARERMPAPAQPNHHEPGRRNVQARRSLHAPRQVLPDPPNANNPAPAEGRPRNRLDGRINVDELIDVEMYRRQQPAANPAAAEVIDLTSDDDIPQQAPGGRSGSQNFRRQNSGVRAHPPAFARSDSSILGGADRPHVVIDLTEEDAEQPQRRNGLPLPGSPELLFVQQRRRAPPPPPPPPPPQLHPRHPPMHFNFLPDLDGFRRGLVGNLNLLDFINPLFGNAAEPFNPIGHVDLQYEHHPFRNRQPSPKPVQEVPPPAREGFTRNTDPETAFVCPGCNEELAYDPEDGPTESQSSRSKGKRSRSEHHFWAVKGCGHVYCADCFENRRPSSKKHKSPFSSNVGDPKSMICAVDGCDVSVAQKTAWVGIYM